MVWRSLLVVHPSINLLIYLYSLLTYFLLTLSSQPYGCLFIYLLGDSLNHFLDLLSNLFTYFLNCLCIYLLICLFISRSLHLCGSLDFNEVDDLEKVFLATFEFIV